MVRKVSLFCALIVTATLHLSAAAQGLKDAKVAFTLGNWKVLRSTDAMKDTTDCTGIYRDNYGIQLTSNRLFIRQRATGSGHGHKPGDKGL